MTLGTGPTQGDRSSEGTEYDAHSRLVLSGEHLKDLRTLTQGSAPDEQGYSGNQKAAGTGMVFWNKNDPFRTDTKEKRNPQGAEATGPKGEQ